jgi:3-hydroxyisobutyrate dehydrogenase
MSENAAVAVLGTGIMGAAMARNLLAAGMEVHVWNRTREKADPLARDGTAVAASPAEATEGAEFMVTMLSDTAAVEDTVEEGALSALGEGGVWIQTSTLGMEGSARLAELASQHGVAYVDAPVLGTRQPAEQGQLIVLASGPEGARERCTPLFEAIGSRTLWLGEAGAGTRLKLVVNNWIVGLVGVLAETVAFARGIGVEPERFLETIEGGPLGLPYARIKGNLMIEDVFPTSFSLALARKDAGLVLEAADAQALRLAITEAVAARFDEALEAGHGDEDLAAVYRVAEGDA